MEIYVCSLYVHFTILIADSCMRVCSDIDLNDFYTQLNSGCYLYGIHGLHLFGVLRLSAGYSSMSVVDGLREIMHSYNRAVKCTAGISLFPRASARCVAAS